jgi:hypothetical protein
MSVVLQELRYDVQFLGLVAFADPGVYACEINARCDVAIDVVRTTDPTLEELLCLVVVVPHASKGDTIVDVHKSG